MSSARLWATKAAERASRGGTRASGVEMETSVSEIQVENREERRSAEASPQGERPGDQAATLCFKRRKKAAPAPRQKPKPTAGSEAPAAARPAPGPAGAGASRQPPRRAGAWASLQRLVTRRKRADSAQAQRHVEAEARADVRAEDAALPKKKPRSRLKIPCVKFSRGGKKGARSQILEDSDCSGRVQGEAEGSTTRARTPSAERAAKAAPAPAPPEASEAPGRGRGPPGEQVIAVELGSDGGRPAVQTGALVLGRDSDDTAQEEEEEEEPGAQAQPAGAPEAAGPEPRSEAEAEDGVPESRPDREDSEREVAVAETEPEDSGLRQESDWKENGVPAEKPQAEESKRMEPIAIIITDTEISEFDVKRSKNVPKPFLVSVDSDGGVEGRTSEQYETLLIETASSLVKNAIQLSIEQLVNEMAADDNRINSPLQ